MQDMILSITEQYGYIGVFLLIIMENIFPPIPSEAILLFGGFMTTYTALNMPVMTVTATFGTLIGAIMLYFVGKSFNKARLEKIIKGKAGILLHLKTSDIEKANHWFDQKGNKAVFFCRFIPLVRSLISIPAGMNNMSMLKFIPFTCAGSLIWNAILILMGRILGKNWTSVLVIMNTYSYVAVTIIGIASIIAAAVFYRRRIGESKERADKDISPCDPLSDHIDSPVSR